MVGRIESATLPAGNVCFSLGHSMSPRVAHHALAGVRACDAGVATKGCIDCPRDRRWPAGSGCCRRDPWAPCRRSGADSPSTPGLSTVPDKAATQPQVGRESVRFSSSSRDELSGPRRCGRIAGCRAFYLPQGEASRLFAVRVRQTDPLGRVVDRSGKRESMIALSWSMEIGFRRIGLRRSKDGSNSGP
jgi:hypothetical protein